MATVILAVTFVQPLIFRKLAGTQLPLRFLSIFQNGLKLLKTLNNLTKRAFRPLRKHAGITSPNHAGESTEPMKSSKWLQLQGKQRYTVVPFESTSPL